MGRRRALAITTEGPGRFHAQETVKTAGGLVSEITVRGDCPLKEVEQLLHAFYEKTDGFPRQQRASS